MNKKQKKMLARIIIAAVLLIVLRFVPITGIPRFICYLAVYLVIGYDIVKKAFKGIKNGQVFDENFLMAIATIGADRKSTRLNSSHRHTSRMPSSA